jgi:hypothetical protein
MRLGLVVLPPAEIAAACVSYAESLTIGRDARMVLGKEKLPHVTLLHVESDEDPAALFAEAQAVLPPTIALSFLSLGLLRYDTPYNAPMPVPARAATMAWLVIPCTSLLRAAEQRALGLPFVSRARLTTGNGDAFQPHMTLAIWNDETPPGAFSLPKTLLSAPPFACRLALGVVGANGTYERTLLD